MASLLEDARPATIDDLDAEFRRLSDWWNRETMFLSNMNQMLARPAYRQIIELGPPVVAILLCELRDNPDWWFDALEELTGANPLSAEDGGNVDQMSAKWVQWGRERGYDL